MEYYASAFFLSETQVSNSGFNIYSPYRLIFKFFIIQVVSLTLYYLMFLGKFQGGNFKK